MGRICFTPLDGHGHINACHGLAEELRARGHEIIFIVDKAFAGRLVKYGFKEHLVSVPSDGSEAAKEFWPTFIEKNAARYDQPPLEQLCDVKKEALGVMLNQGKLLKSQYDEALATLKPDLIIHDGYICFPSVVYSNIPWIWLFSAAPQLLLNDRRIPPTYSGLPIDGDKGEWEDFQSKVLVGMKSLYDQVNQFSVENGGAEMAPGTLHPLSSLMNIFMQPRELRYTELTDLPSNIVGVDCFVRTVPDQTFTIPESIRDKPGKLIFFSMGSFGSAHVGLMTRLVAMLAKSPHRFIVSKGPLKYDLPGDNLYGEAFLPQTAILPQVDMVITHGGNNTVTETFYYGKKMLVMPMFMDQYDNAQRIQEVGLGLRLNPFRCTEKELLKAIDKLANDEQITEKMAKIGERIRSNRDKQMVADKIDDFLSKTTSL